MQIAYICIVMLGFGGWRYRGGWGRQGQEIAFWILLLVAEKDLHGYEMLNRLREMGIMLNPGTLYRTLRALEGQGLMISSWDTTGGPARRLYRLTNRGKEYLYLLKNEMENERKRLNEMISLLENLERRR